MAATRPNRLAVPSRRVVPHRSGGNDATRRDAPVAVDQSRGDDVALTFPIEDLLPIAWSKGQVVQVAHFRHNDSRIAALASLHAMVRAGAFGVIAHDIPVGREA